MFTQFNGTQIALMGCGCAILVWLIVRGRMMRHRQRQAVSQLSFQLKHNGNASHRPITFRGTESMGAPREVLQWQVELHDLARELKGELECKLIAVRQVAQSYDRAASRLEALIQAGQHAGSPDSPAAQMIRLSQSGFSVQQIAEQFAVDAKFVSVLLGQQQRV